MKVMYTGTFNPWHRGHQNIYDQACAIFGKKNVHVVVAKNIKKTQNGNNVLGSLNAIIPKENLHINEGLTQRYCTDFGFDIIVRGLRGIEDCHSEFTMADWNDRVKTVFLYCNDPSLRKLSSSLIRELEFHEPGIARKHLISDHQYYRWKLKNQRSLKFMFFGKIASGKSFYIRDIIRNGACYKSDYNDLDKNIWSDFSDLEESNYRRILKDCIILNNGPRYESIIKEMSEKIDWRKLLWGTHIEASALGVWFKYIPANILSEFTLVKVETKKESTRFDRCKKRGLLDHEVVQFDKFYKDSPFYDKIVRV